MEFYDFPSVGNVRIPTDEVIFFQRGRAQPPTRIEMGNLTYRKQNRELGMVSILDLSSRICYGRWPSSTMYLLNVVMFFRYVTLLEGVGMCISGTADHSKTSCGARGCLDICIPKETDQWCRNVGLSKIHENPIFDKPTYHSVGYVSPPCIHSTPVKIIHYTPKPTQNCW